MNKVVQINLNKQSRATDLLLQYMRENNISLAAVSEPSSVPDDPGWAASSDGLAAVTWRGSVRNLECVLVASGEGFCIVSWGEAFICSCYFSPNRTLEAFEDWLNALEVSLTPFLRSPIYVLGDFNARHGAWDLGGFNDRGGPLVDTMVGLDFLIGVGRLPPSILGGSRLSTHPGPMERRFCGWLDGVSM